MSDYGDLAKLLGCENDYVAINDAILGLIYERETLAARLEELASAVDDALVGIYWAESPPRPKAMRIEAALDAAPVAKGA